MAGHSKWANIKHRKARQDARRSKIWSKCSRAIIVAAKNGGADPAANLALRYAIDDAKAANMPKDTIEKAIRKGAGDDGAANYEAAVYEGYAPAGVAVMVDCLTDNKNRTVPELRKIFEKRGGSLGTSGCVSYLFESRGEIYLDGAGVDEDTVMSAALEAGADDVQQEPGAESEQGGAVWRVTCSPSDFLDVREGLEQAGLKIESASVTMSPLNTVACAGEDAAKVVGLIDDLEDHDDVQKVYANYEIPDEELASLQ